MKGSDRTKAIETVYNGYRFRSRLEARWAVFFDACGIKYQYEPEGFELDDGTYYLPDFYLPDVGGRAHGGLWVEVKGVMTETDRHKVDLFSKAGSAHSVLVVGEIPSGSYTLRQDVGSLDDGYWNCETVDGDFYPIEFYREADGSIGIWGVDNVDDFSGFDWFEDKYIKARQARFEHGEKP